MKVVIVQMKTSKKLPGNRFTRKPSREAWKIWSAKECRVQYGNRRQDICCAAGCVDQIQQPRYSLAALLCTCRLSHFK